MATMNATNVGGPVGGGMMMMNNNNGSPAVPGTVNSSDNLRCVLNTFVFDYLLKHGHYDIARSVLRDDKFEMRTESKSSPGRRKDGDLNGDTGDGMDLGMKDDVPEDIPRPSGWDGSQTSGFLLEWFGIFHDLLTAHRMSPNKLNGTNMNMTAASTYLQHEKQMQRMRENAQNQNINRPGMNPAMMRQMQNGVMNKNMNGQLTPQQLQQMQNRKAQMMQQQLRGGDQPDGEMNGARPGTPGEGDNGGSPSKRPRLDNGQPQFNNGMMQGGRPGVPGAANQGMMIQAGFNPGMNPQFRGNGAMPPKGMQAGMANGMMNMGNAGSPMMQNVNQFPPDGMQMDMSYQRNMQAGQPGMQGGGGQSGNHALQDYQMQLMLLEQQNKKRLMMARQEQHENNPANGGPMPGVGMQGTGLSPNGSRTGNSPNPGEMKRTPGMGGGLPGSPSAAEAMAGRSPVGMSFMGNMQNPDFNGGGMFMGGKDQPMMGGPGMRPPTSDMNQMRQQGARGNNQFPGSQPMAQQASQGGGQGMGTPGQRNDMPPPQAPAANGAQRTAGGSPSNNAPPTPSQANKPNPTKAKKGAAKEDAKRARPTKKNSSANANAPDENPPATPTPSTPITPNNPGVINAGNKGQAGMQQNNQHQQHQGIPMGQQMDQQDLGQGNAFGDFGNAQDPQFNLDFSTLEDANVLENFDFDSFLNTSADGMLDFNADMGVGGDFSMNQNE